MRTINIKFTQDEILPLLNVLNEVCNGLYITNFEKSIGADENFVMELKNRISKEQDKLSINLNFTDFELLILNNCFKEVYKQIDEIEFHTHIGIFIPEALKIEEKFKIE